MDRIYDLTDVGNTSVGCSIYFHHVYMATFHDGGAVFALTTWFSSWFASAV